MFKFTDILDTWKVYFSSWRNFLTVVFPENTFPDNKTYKAFTLQSLSWNDCQGKKIKTRTGCSQNIPGDQNLKFHENLDFQAGLALETRFSSPGRLRCRAMCKKTEWLVEPLSSVRVIRVQGWASWHVQIYWHFGYMEGLLFIMAELPDSRFPWKQFPGQQNL